MDTHSSKGLYIAVQEEARALSICVTADFQHEFCGSIMLGSPTLLSRISVGQFLKSWDLP